MTDNMTPQDLRDHILTLAIAALEEQPECWLREAICARADSCSNRLRTL